MSEETPRESDVTKRTGHHEDLESEHGCESALHAPAAVERILGWAGRMLALSKTEYQRRHPANVVVFNANVCTRTRKIWFGDLDITNDELLLANVATALNETVYVLEERDARFDTEQQPRLCNSVLKVTADGIAETRDWIVRDVDGRLRLRGR